MTLPDPSAPDILIDAIRFGDRQQLKALVDTLTPDQISGPGEEGTTALAVAVLSREKEAVEILLAGGADPNALNCDGTGPLSQVACLEICRSLLSAGARVMRESPDHGYTSVHDASAAGQTDILELLLAHDGKGALSCFDECGWTPLHQAAFYNQIECARILLRFGADPHLYEKETGGRTALELAESTSNRPMVMLLSSTSEA